MVVIYKTSSYNSTGFIGSMPNVNLTYRYDFSDGSAWQTIL